LRCTDVRITGVKFLRSRSWTINPYACKRLLIDSVYIYSSQKEGVWADGIDPDGCQDVRISNSTIETGDDALVFYSSDTWGPALPVENVTVTNCRLSSSSSAIKFCDGNSNAIRRVNIDNVNITNSNRGIAFMVFDGGIVEDVVLSNLTIETAVRLVLVGRWRPIAFQHQTAERGGRNEARQGTGCRQNPQRDHSERDCTRHRRFRDQRPSQELVRGRQGEQHKAFCVIRSQRSL
jgi:polygalacturonase